MVFAWTRMVQWNTRNFDKLKRHLEVGIDTVNGLTVVDSSHYSDISGVSSDSVGGCITHQKCKYTHIHWQPLSYLLISV